MSKFKRKRGFLTIAQNGQHDYLRMAYALALSLRASQRDVPWLSVMVTPGMTIPDRYQNAFDEIIEIPWNDDAYEHRWKIHNEWKVYHCTPYEETIKIEADMLVLNSIDHYWDFFSDKDLWFTSNVRTYRDEIITNDTCRKTFTSNNLPNVYNGLMYFRKTDFTHAFYRVLEKIFHNWSYFSDHYLDHTRPDEVATDEAYALAIQLLNIEKDVMDNLSIPTFVHMKTELQNWHNAYVNDWTTGLLHNITEDLDFKVENYLQKHPFHYHEKKFLQESVINLLENYNGRNTSS